MASAHMQATAILLGLQEESECSWSSLQTPLQVSKEPQSNQLQKPGPLFRQGLPNSLKRVSVKDPLVSECLGAAFNSVREVLCNKRPMCTMYLQVCALYLWKSYTRTRAHVRAHIHTHTHTELEDRSAILCPLVPGDAAVNHSKPGFV